MNKPSRYTPIIKNLTGPEAGFIAKLHNELAQREFDARVAKATLRQALSEIQTLQNLKIFGLTREDRKAMECTELRVRKEYRDAAAALIEARSRHNEAVRRICEAKLARQKYGVKPAPKPEVKRYVAELSDGSKRTVSGPCYDTAYCELRDQLKGSGLRIDAFHWDRGSCQPKLPVSGNKTVQLDGESYELIKEGYFSVDLDSAKELFVKLHKAIARLEENPQLRMIVHFQSK